MVRELTDAVQDLGSREDVRVIVLGGRGEVFCAGADLAWMRPMADFSRDENLADARRLAELFRVVDESPKPVVARVHGAALGGGAGLVAAADISVASEATRFGFTEVRLGLIPAVISPYVCARIGVTAARELFLTGERFGAERARELRLVSHVVGEADLDEAVAGRVAELLRAGPRAVSAAKALVRAVARGPSAEVEADVIERIAEIRTTPEAQEGIRAFLEKRKPDWRQD
jgi:methylglutaconyl-CoA hydratase